MTRPVLVGECNPYGGDPYYALYPAPDGCAGHRLCCLILGMRRSDYLAAFERVNLYTGTWRMSKAREAVKVILRGREQSGRFILLGAKVCAAFGVPFAPFDVSPSGLLLVLPHPSGLCRLWNEPGAVRRARLAVRRFCPEVYPEHLTERTD